MNDRREEIQTFIRRILEHRGDRREFSDSESLILSRRLDSIDVVEIIAFLEERYGADFADTGFNQLELDSVDAIVLRSAA